MSLYIIRYLLGNARNHVYGRCRLLGICWSALFFFFLCFIFIFRLFWFKAICWVSNDSILFEPLWVWILAMMTCRTRFFVLVPLLPFKDPIFCMRAVQHDAVIWPLHMYRRASLPMWWNGFPYSSLTIGIRNMR